MAIEPGVVFNFLQKFQAKTTRVKCLAFHPTRHWILAAMYNGQIHLRDWRLGTLIHTFHEHTCLHFLIIHSLIQALFPLIFLYLFFHISF